MNSASKTPNDREAAFTATFSEIHGSTYMERDAQGLARLGKSQVLKRRFGFLSIFGFSCCILATWESALASVRKVSVSNAELKLWKTKNRFRWLTSLAWIATLAVGSIFTGTIIQGLIVLNYPDYEPKNFHGAFLAWAVIAVAIFVNIVIAGLLPVLEGVILFIHVLGFIAILITLVYLSPHGSAEDVFFRTLNEGNWPTQGLSFCIGFIGNVATFVGADASIHMAEEIENAAMNVPRAIVTTVILNGTTGWAMVIAVLFCLGDIQSVIVDSRTRIPVIAVIVVTVIPCLLNLIYIGSSTAFNDVISMSVSGLYASYLLPCSFLLWRRATGQIKPHRPSEDRSVEMPAGGDGGRNAPHNLTLEDNNGDSDVLLEEPTLEWGPWRLPGLLGTLNNSFACLYCVWVLFWDFWPPTRPVTGENMNYSVLVTGAVIIFAVARYFLGGKVGYRGPLVDYDVKGFTTHHT
ncbi:hypothetical protein ABKA04_003375 [Annulohypoxylon sp. FPYF3050]